MHEEIVSIPTVASGTTTDVPIVASEFNTGECELECTFDVPAAPTKGDVRTYRLARAQWESKDYYCAVEEDSGIPSGSVIAPVATGERNSFPRRFNRGALGYRIKNTLDVDMVNVYCVVRAVPRNVRVEK